jgi:hypothetical protein
MNVFMNIYQSWTIYEWVLIGGSLILIFLLTNLATYLLTKNWSFNKPISMTYLLSAFLYILLIFITQFLPYHTTHLSLIPILVISVIVTMNWVTFISYYNKYKNSKNFSLVKLLKEHKNDTVKNITFLTIAMLPVTIFITDEHLIVIIVIYICSSISMYINTLLSQKFIND